MIALYVDWHRSREILTYRIGIPDGPVYRWYLSRPFPTVYPAVAMGRV